ncbi:glutamine-hydrolyzing GMP synthase [Candidatus Woesearchaeota archaeon]|nr:glutamine-hydrolyzing GMP synthase [Candidatus Woesearchaeota archaeon]
MAQIIVINFGSQVAHLIARRIRELGIFTEIKPYGISANEIKKLKPKGIILSGGPSSVYEKNSPLVDKKILELNIPVLGICYGLQLIGKYYGKVIPGKLKEYGKKRIRIRKNGNLLYGLKREEEVWMSHGDLVTYLPKNFEILAKTDTCPIAAVENNDKKIYGVQFHPEVAHTPKGVDILKNFVFRICNAKKDWSISLAPKLIREIKEIVKNDSVIMGTSGGVDSTVAAALIHKAIGKKMHCVFIDHGLLRKNEAEAVMDSFKSMDFENLYLVNAEKIFLERLRGIAEPEEKRRIIGHTFIEVFEKKVEELEKKYYGIKFLGQGTIYPDRIESAQPTKEASKIKSHHNVTLPEKMKLKVIEPLKELYKDEVRKLGKELSLPKEIVYRHPFPGPGFAIRILGEITNERLEILRNADYIFIEELKKAKHYDKVWQAFAALFPIKTVGVKGDARTYEYVISLRAVTSFDAMTADWAKLPYGFLEKVSSRIINEVKGVNRVVYDISQKPPATIEYE